MAIAQCGTSYQLAYVDRNKVALRGLGTAQLNVNLLLTWDIACRTTRYKLIQRSNLLLNLNLHMPKTDDRVSEVAMELQERLSQILSA